MPIKESTSDAGVQSSFMMVDWSPIRQSTNALAPTTTTTVKSKDNPYAMPRFDKCYRYGGPGHRSNERPKRKQVNMADYGDNEEEGFGI